MTVSELCQVVQIPQSTVSRHLGVLSQEGWVTARSEGTSRHYRLAPSLDPTAKRLWEAVKDEVSDGAMAREDRIRAESVLEVRAQRSETFFSSQAGRWDHLRRELFGARAELQLLAGLLDPEEVVADLGCGTGQLTRLLAPYASRVVAVDRSPEMLDLARQRLREYSNVELHQGELETLPLEAQSVDVAIFALVLHYVVNPGRAFAEAHRILRPGGRLLIVDMQQHDRAAFREDMGHVWLGFSPDELGGWLEAADFRSPVRDALPADPEAEGPLLFSLRAFR